MRATRSWSRRRAPSSRPWARGSCPRPRRGSGCSCTDVSGVPIYQTAILPEWIDYNGHLRDAYYVLIVSLACDALMDRLRMDAAYRQRTLCTLYTVEMHIHYLHEVKATDTAIVAVRIAGADHKRIHAAFEILRAGHTPAAALAASRVIGYCGEVWRVHPHRPCGDGEHYFRSVDELPRAPDAAFIAATNHEVPAIAAALARRGAGGFVCFAAGFSETGSSEGERLTRELLASAGALPFFGPNCYGFINFFDGAALWPDQVIGSRCQRGVALICQSGTIALDLSFNDRSLPIGYVLTVGNQTRLAAEDLIELLAQDARVTAFGLYLEGVRDAARFARAAERARAAGKPIALIKAGRTAAATRTVRTHTGSLAGADAAFAAFCAQAGIPRRQ